MLDASSLSAMTSNVKEIMNIKSISISVLVIFVGLGIIVLSSWMEDKSSSSYIGGNTLAVILLIFGFYRLLCKRTHLVYLPTNSEMVEGSFFFDAQDLESLKRGLTEEQLVDYSKYTFMKSGNGRLDYIVSKDGNFVAVQLYQYIPYTFEAASEIYCHEHEIAQHLGQFLLSKHGNL